LHNFLVENSNKPENAFLNYQNEGSITQLVRECVGQLGVEHIKIPDKEIIILWNYAILGNIKYQIFYPEEGKENESVDFSDEKDIVVDGFQFLEFGREFLRKNRCVILIKVGNQQKEEIRIGFFPKINTSPPKLTFENVKQKVLQKASIFENFKKVF